MEIIYICIRRLHCSLLITYASCGGIALKSLDLMRFFVKHIEEAKRARPRKREQQALKEITKRVIKFGIPWLLTFSWT